MVRYGFHGAGVTMLNNCLTMKNYLKAALLVFLATILGSCQFSQLQLPGQSKLGGQQAGSKVAGPLAPATGEVIGNGPVRVALLLPLSAPGNAGTVGKELANAAKLAMKDFGQNTIQLVIKNTAGQAAGAQESATAAIREGSTVVLGPLISGSVSAASAVTLPANIPLVAFSSDPRRARRGVYLMSFSPQADIKRAINYAVSQGKTSFAALLPKGAYGVLAEASMKQTLSGNGGQLVSLQKYDHSNDSIQAAATAIAGSTAGATTIYIPDGGKVPSALIAALKRSGVNVGSKMVLGSGQWESTNLADPSLNGAYYPGRDKRQYANFASRYKATYGAQPSSTAGLAYDAVSMVAGLARHNGRNAFSFANIESRNGYSGVTGIFRFESSGKADRGLVIYQVQNNKAKITSQAPSTFGPGS